MNVLFILFLSICSLLFFSPIRCSKILFVSAPESGSHRGLMYPLATALKTRGHDVTIFSEVVIDHKDNEGPVKEKLVKLQKVDPELAKGIVFQNTSNFIKMIWELKSSALMLIFGWKMSAESCSSLLTYQKEDFWQIANQSWDLVFVDRLIAICGMAIASIGTAPTIIFHTSLVDNPTAKDRGIPPVPHLTPPMFDVPEHGWAASNMFDRLKSIEEFCIWEATRLVINWMIESAMRGVVSNFSFSSYTKNAAAAFSDYPQAIDWPRPIGMDSVYIGSTCKIVQNPLPQDLEEFVNDPRSKGTILVAFGTLGNWAIAPEYISQKFFTALSQITEYRIIFQYKGDASIFPSHIKAMKWLPQVDILLHPKTKLFISHGGLKSLKEALCAEVPVLFLPLFAEQERNALAAELLGFGEK